MSQLFETTERIARTEFPCGDCPKGNKTEMCEGEMKVEACPICFAVVSYDKPTSTNVIDTAEKDERKKKRSDESTARAEGNLITKEEKKRKEKKAKKETPGQESLKL